MSSTAFYLPDGEAFVATEATRGPWSNAHQHAGPPSALLARALERAVEEARGDAHLVRILVELPRPVPIGRVSLEVGEVEGGRRVSRVEAVMRAEGVEVARARGLFMRTASLELPEAARLPPEPPPALPRPSEGPSFPFFLSDVGYHTAMELRFTRGGFGEARSSAWMRQRVPLVEGEEPSPAQRVLVVADSGNGITNVLDPRRFLFVNADLIVTFLRPLRGAWVHMDARVDHDPSGSGIAHTELGDGEGAVARGLQSLLVAPAPG